MTRSILIAGGGTAGWITACYMARALGLHRNVGNPDAPTVTLIESPDIGIIGVGEGTFPTIKATLQALGIDEAEFMRESSATFKQGIRFANWQKDPATEGEHHYFHPFENPHGVNGSTLALYWHLLDEQTRPPFAAALSMQQRIAEAMRAPKRLHDGPYKGPLQYAYHLDAHKFARFLAAHAQSLGVRHISGTIDGVVLDESGGIGHVHSAEHGDLKADFYFDCTGIRAELIGKALGVPFKAVDDKLFTDRAVACQVPYPEPDTPIESYTVSTAHEAGWTWDIGLDTRRGVGYVYSSRHTSDDAAEATLRRYVGDAAKDVSARLIRFNAGYREDQWKNNCVAIGLSAGFFEPLESTGLVLIEIAAGMMAEFFTLGGPADAAARRFNFLMKNRCEKIVNFLKLHYCLSQRPEPFWRDNADPASNPEELLYMLDMWKHRPPSRFDFLSEIESFSYFSYQCVLYGMGFKTDMEPARTTFPDMGPANRWFERIEELSAQGLRDLPPHRALVEQVYRSGFTGKPGGVLSVKMAR
ncbi:MAG: tryptophan 7-halogenase [Asticcacaulis sp.]|nr:tryptophan 7-halogenase [Asticcacaulis sp.]